MGAAVLKDLVLESALNSVHLEQGGDVHADALVLLGIEEDISKNKQANKSIGHPRATAARGGGFFLGNMKRISKFNNVNMTRLRATYGGCMFVKVDQNFRYQDFNKDPYKFTNVRLHGCIARKDGAGMYVDNVRDMQVSGPASEITKSHAKGAGGGVFFHCAYESKMKDAERCKLYFGAVNITRNTAHEGGGLKWSYKPEFVEARVYDNKARFYGNNFAAYATKMVRFTSQSVPGNEDKPIVGQQAEDHYKNYAYARSDSPTPAKGPVAAKAAEHSTQQEIKNVQSGAEIAAVYLALVDDYDQVVSTNKGSIVSYDISDKETTISGS